ncbi:MAG: hypothetical protein WAW17_15655, partial [Rhodococcus sp. (in: high G+C Gram-positive bacteria)]|uniref:hypothetical protein n=1 Tax=Rhodococcus sp. TaxID=1831 RepID=UPI003BB1F86A
VDNTPGHLIAGRRSSGDGGVEGVDSEPSLHSRVDRVAHDAIRIVVGPSFRTGAPGAVGGDVGVGDTASSPPVSPESVEAKEQLAKAKLATISAASAHVRLIASPHSV